MDAEKREKRRIFLLVSPATLWLTIFFVLPISILFVLSFWRHVPGKAIQPAFVLDNYTSFLGDWYHIKILLRTIWLGFIVTFFSLIIGFPVASAITKAGQTLRGVLYVLVLAPLMTSAVVRTFGWMILLGENGFLNDCIIALGLVDAPIKFMYSTTAIVIALTEVLAPFMILSLVGVLQDIDRSLYEAAQNLGSKAIRIFLTITLPLSIPGIAAGSILVFSLAISAYVTPALMGGARTPVMPTLVYDEALNNMNWPFGGAISFSLLLIILLILYAYVKFLRLGKLADILR